MLRSARPVSCFSNYDSASNDMRDHIWEHRMRTAYRELSAVQLRPCMPPHSVPGRFLSEKELVSRVLTGDKQAAHWFVRRFERLVAAVVNDMPIHSEDRHDVCQQVFMRLWEQDCRRLRLWFENGRGRLASYLGAIIRRTAYDWMRKYMRVSARSVCCTPRHSESRSTAANAIEDRQTTMFSNSTVVVDTEVLVIVREQKRAIRHAVTSLLRRDSELLRRRYYRGQSYSEIAAAMGMTVNCVGVAINRAQKRMHDKLCLRYPGLFEQPGAALL